MQKYQMELNKASPIPYKVIVFSIIAVIIAALYSLKHNVIELGDQGTMVSLCQIRFQFDGSYGFDDRALLSLLSTLKMHDFYIGQPVWGPTDTLLYFCEHRLKMGFKQAILDKELHNVIKNGPISTARVFWSCA